MRVLLLSNADPNDFSSGGNQRSNYIRQALLRVAQVDTIVISQGEASSCNSGWGPERVLRIGFSSRVNAWKKAKQRLIARRVIAEAEATNDYDFIVARYFGTAMLVPFGAHRKLVIDADDVRQTGSGQPFLKRVLLRIRASVIQMVARRAAHVWLVDQRDRMILPGARCSMLPNTARAMHLPVVPSDPPRRLLMVGMYSYPPNEEGLIWFVQQILPNVESEFPDVELYAVGRFHNQLLTKLNSRLSMRGYVSDLDSEYAQASLIICPVFSGSGTQIKVLEAVMSGRPTVASDFSYQGFADVLRSHDHLLVAHDREEWTHHVTSVLRDPSAFSRMAQEGCRVAQDAYSVGSFHQRVIDTLHSGDLNQSSD